ncbi:gas vesicle protein GvpJ [Promicromonospora sp. NPDC057138]|uniref:gas vesicle protein GvpJ n=1 Tax=Promicromonospora sp. NPDC057138 TaxID=3346031 RepID=UPI003642BD77
MAEVARSSPRGYVERPQPSSLADVVELILDKGLVLDVFVRVSLVGIEVLTIDARIVIASVDTYLRFAKAANRLDLEQVGGRDLPELVEDMSESGSSGKTKGMLQGAKEALIGSGDDKSKSKSKDEDQDEDQPRARKEPQRRQGRTTPQRSRRER